MAGTGGAGGAGTGADGEGAVAAGNTGVDNAGTGVDGGAGGGAPGNGGTGGGTSGNDGAGGAGTADSALSAPGPAEMEGAVTSAGKTGDGGSSAMPGFAANSAAAKKIHPMRFIRFLPVPLSLFIAFPGCSAAPRPAACRTAKEPTGRPVPRTWEETSSYGSTGEMREVLPLSECGCSMPVRGRRPAAPAPVAAHRGGSTRSGLRLPRRWAPRRRAAEETPGRPPSTATRPSRSPSP